ncbi:34056_t:CDS:2, partial [Gigaspora margarita]
GNRILVEHWISAKAQNYMTRMVSKCKGCALNTLKASPNCVSRIYKYNIIGVFLSLEKLIEAGHLLLSPEMFERSGIKSKEAGALTGENAWNTLTPEAKSKIIPLAISRIIFGRDINSRADIRLNMPKGLISQKVVDKLNEFFPSYRDTKVAIMAVLQGYWNHFYEDIWKKRCDQIIVWEKRRGITKQSKQPGSCSPSNVR